MLKRFVVVLFSALFTLACFASCSGTPTVSFSEDLSSLRCGPVTLQAVEPGDYSLFVPPEFCVYEQREIFRREAYTVLSSVDRQIVALVEEDPFAEDYEPEESFPISAVYATGDALSSLNDFSNGIYGSYALFSRKMDTRADVPSDLFTEKYLEAEPTEIKATKLGEMQWRTVWGYDATETFTRPVGVVLKAKDRYYYFDHAEYDYNRMRDGGWVKIIGGLPTSVREFNKEGRKLFDRLQEKEVDSSTALTLPSVAEACRNDFLPAVYEAASRFWNRCVIATTLVPRLNGVIVLVLVLCFLRAEYKKGDLR